MNIAKALHGWEIWNDAKHVGTLEQRPHLVTFLREVVAQDETGWVGIKPEDLLELLTEPVADGGGPS